MGSAFDKYILVQNELHHSVIVLNVLPSLYEVMGKGLAMIVIMPYIMEVGERKHCRLAARVLATSARSMGNTSGTAEEKMFLSQGGGGGGRRRGGRRVG